MSYGFSPQRGFDLDTDIFAEIHRGNTFANESP
jgi:hypothetical protein